MKFLVVLLVSTFAFAVCNALEYEDCGSKSTIENVKVSDCDVSGECHLKRKTNVTISFDFTPNIEASEVQTVVHGEVLDIPIPFPIPNADACKFGGLHCPLEPNTKNSYTAQLEVLKSYPKVKVIVKWELKNEKGDDVACLQIPVKIV